MKTFKEFGITTTTKALTGDKIKMERILNREIEVHAYRLEDSKFNGKCLHLQICVNGNMHVVFTGSANLTQAIEMVPKDGFPFLTTIVKENERFEFK